MNTFSSTYGDIFMGCSGLSGVISLGIGLYAPNHHGTQLCILGLTNMMTAGFYFNLRLSILYDNYICHKITEKINETDRNIEKINAKINLLIADHEALNLIDPEAVRQIENAE